jgi:Flp pilus assembly protein TadD
MGLRTQTRFLRFSALLIAAVFATSTASAQKAGGTGGGTVGGGGGNIPTPGGGATRPTIPTTPTTPTSPTRQQTPYPDTRRPIFLTGKVLISDGSAPSEPVTIERVCQGYTRPEGYTDSKGRFSITLGQNNGMAMADASHSTFDPLNPNQGSLGTNTQGVDTRQLMSCEIRASLPGFRSDTISLANRRSLDNPEIGTIYLHRLGNVEGLTVSATTAMAPKDAKKAFDKGREAAMKGKLDDGIKQLSKAVEIYPKYAVAWNELGRMHMAQKEVEAARSDFNHALEADSKYVSPYGGLAELAARENKWKEVAEITDKAIRLNPVEVPESYFYNAIANLNLKNLDAAERSANEMMKSDLPNRNPKAYHVAGLIYAQKGEYQEAAVNLKKYIEAAPPGSGAEAAKQQLAEVERLASAAPPNPAPAKP